MKLVVISPPDVGTESTDPGKLVPDVIRTVSCLKITNSHERKRIFLPGR